MSDSSPLPKRSDSPEDILPSAQAYPPGKADTLRRKSLSHLTVPAVSAGATDHVPRLYHTLFSCFHYMHFLPAVNAFAAFSYIFVTFARFFAPCGAGSVQPVGQKQINDEEKWKDIHRIPQKRADREKRFRSAKTGLWDKDMSRSLPCGKRPLDELTIILFFRFC